MNSSKGLTILIIIVSVVGIVYFGSRSLDLTRLGKTENPFEYDIEEFENSGTENVSYQVADEFKLDMQKPRALAVAPNDNWIIGGQESLKIYSPTMELQTEIAMPHPVFAVTTDDSSRVYAAMREHFRVYQPDGQLLLTSDYSGATSYFTSIAVYENRVVVADAGNRIVKVFDRMSGEEIGTIGEKDEDAGVPEFVIPSPYFDLAIDEQGFLWVVNPGRHMFENFTLDGDFRTQWSRTSMRADGFSGCCNPSHFALLPDGSFVTTEKGIPRIKIHDQHGEFKTMVAPAKQFAEDADGLDVAVDSRQRIWVLYPKESKILVFAKIANS